MDRSRHTLPACLLCWSELGPFGQVICALTIGLYVRTPDGYLARDPLDEEQATSPTDCRVHDLVAGFDRPVDALQTCFIEAPSDPVRDIETIFERIKSLEEEKMAAMFVTVYLDGMPHHGFAVHSGWHGSHSLRFRQPYSAERQAALLHVAEILVTVELGKVVLVDEKTNRVESLKPLAWRPAQVVPGSVIARERQRVLKDRTNQYETSPNSATDGSTSKVSKPVVINEVKKFEAFRSQEIDYGFYFIEVRGFGRAGSQIYFSEERLATHRLDAREDVAPRLQAEARDTQTTGQEAQISQLRSRMPCQ